MNAYSSYQCIGMVQPRPIVFALALFLAPGLVEILLLLYGLDIDSTLSRTFIGVPSLPGTSSILKYLGKAALISFNLSKFILESSCFLFINIISEFVVPKLYTHKYQHRAFSFNIDATLYC